MVGMLIKINFTFKKFNVKEMLILLTQGQLSASGPYGPVCVCVCGGGGVKVLNSKQCRS